MNKERILAVCAVKDDADAINNAADNGDELAKDVIQYYTEWYENRDIGNEELENKILNAHQVWKAQYNTN